MLPTLTRDLTERIFIYAGGKRIAMSAYQTGGSAVLLGGEENGEKYFILQDHLGSTSSLVNSLGEETSYTEYHPFGDIKFESATKAFTKKFTGKELDDSTGLYDYDARQYDPEIKRFITPDPVDPDLNDPQSLNRYSYVLNNPLKYIDPTGNFVAQSIFIGGATTVIIIRAAIAAASVFIGARAINQLTTTPPFSLSSLSFRIPGFSSGALDSVTRSGPIGGSMMLAKGNVNQAAQGGSSPSETQRTESGESGGQTKPTAENPRLQRVIDKLYQPGDKLPGGTAGAVRHEKKTGELLSPSGHSQKAQERATQLGKILRQENLSPKDRATAERLRRDLGNALSSR